MSEKNITKRLFSALAALLILTATLIAICGCEPKDEGIIRPMYYGWVNTKSYNVEAIQSEELSIHFLYLENKYKGECIYIKAGDTDMLIDGGNRKFAATPIANYLNQYVTDGKLEYVIVTHSHRDHVAALIGDDENTGLLKAFQVDTLIDFPKTNSQLVNEETGKKTNYGAYLSKLEAAIKRGTKHYTALECYNNENGASRKYQLSDTVELEFLYNYYYDHDTTIENDNSVCLFINQKVSDDKINHYFFAGDLYATGEAKLVEFYGDKLPHCVLYNANHHGSSTSSSSALMERLSPEYVCVSCCAGTSQSGDDPNRHHPMPSFVANVAPYTDRVYVTTQVDNYCPQSEWDEKGTVKPMNGNIVFTCSKGTVTMYFSGSDAKLKDSDWFKANRDCPGVWM